MNTYECYHIVRAKGTQDAYERVSDRVEARNVFDALEFHRYMCEFQNLETAGGLVTHRIVGGVGQPIQKGQL